MILSAIVISLVLQVPQPAAPRPAAPAAVSGVVVNGSTNEPIANVRVSLARTDAGLGVLEQMMASERPPAEATLPAEVLAAIGEQMAVEMARGGVSATESAEAKAFASLPLADIQELIISPSGQIGLVYKSAPPMMTDSQGRFAFNTVAPGTYKLVFARNGYARQDFGQRGAGSTGIPLVLNAGQVKNDVVMRMSPVSAINGRLLDSSGQPAAGVPVQLYRFAYDETGERKVQRAAVTQTNDRGEYRIYFLSPGRYYLNAGHLPGQNSPPGIAELLGQTQVSSLTSNRIPEKYTLTYYPGVGDMNSATPIDVPPGADLKGLDLYLKVQQTFRIRGNVLDTRTGQPPATAIIDLAVQSSDPQFSSFLNRGPGDGPNYNASDGTFELRNVSSGGYIATVNLPSPAVQRPPDFASMSPEQQRAYNDAQNAANAARPRASAAVNVTTGDVDGVVLRVAPAGSITGRFRIDPNASNTAPQFPFMRLQLKSVDGAVPASGNSPQSGAAKEDGTFRIDGLWSGEYRLIVNGLPSGFYVKEARLGDIDVLNARLRFSTADAGTLDILISPALSQIDGIAASSAGQPMPGSRVVLVPEKNRDRTELFRPATADPSGHFTLANVAPGDYKLVAWESIEPFEFFDVERIKQADDNGKLVRVAESSKQTINVIPIP